MSEPSSDARRVEPHGGWLERLGIGDTGALHYREVFEPYGCDAPGDPPRAHFRTLCGIQPSCSAVVQMPEAEWTECVRRRGRCGTCLRVLASRRRAAREAKGAP